MNEMLRGECTGGPDQLFEKKAVDGHLHHERFESSSSYMIHSLSGKVPPPSADSCRDLLAIFGHDNVSQVAPIQLSSSTAHSQVSGSAAGHQTAGASKGQTASASKTPNPTYVDARLYAAKFFGRHGELAQLLSQACRDGLHAFSIRTSEQYNKSDSMGLMIFQLALAAVPAAGVLAQTLHELSTSEKLQELTRLGATIKRLAGASEKVHKAIEKVASASDLAHKAIGKVEGAAERVKKVSEAAEKGHTISEAGEGKEKGDFEMATISNLSDLMSDSVAVRWRNEDYIDEKLEQLEYVDPAIDLKENVEKVLGKLPSADAVKGAVREVAEEFELRLYVQYYVEPGKVTYVLDEQDGASRAEFEGIPRAVVRRFMDLNKASMLIEHKNLKRRHMVRFWSGNRV